MFSSRIPPLLVPNAWTRSLSDRRARGLPVLDLSAGNPTLTGLSLLAEAGEQFARCSAGAYEPAPLGQWHARAAVARYFEGRGLTVRAESVVLTASTSESYAQLFRLLASPGERIAAPVPGYPLFEPLARAEGVTLSRYRLEFDGEWHLDRGSFVRAMQGARAVIVVEPNYPTGSCLSAEDRAFVLEHCGQQGAAVISDEVFGDFPLGVVGVRPLSWLAGEEPVPVPVFVLGGLSKLCGLPQFKLGWIVVRGPAAARAEALAALEWLGDLFLGLAGPVQAALPSLLELRHEFGRRVRERTRANLGVLDEFVSQHPELTRLPAQGGWTALVQLPARRDDEAWALALLERGVAVHPGHFYDLGRGEYLAISLIVEPGDLVAGLGVLRNVLET